MKLKLDTKTITSLELAKGRAEEFAWDAELEGFGLRLRRSGDGVRRTYVAQYRIGARRSRRVTIGPAEKLVPAQARQAARKILAKVALGHDPQGEKEAKREAAAQTFKAVVDDYLADRQAALRPMSFKIARLYLTGPYFRPLHLMPISEIKRSHVAGCIRSITRDRSNATANAARNNLSPLFAWAISQGMLGDNTNPVDGAPRAANPVPRDRVLSNNELVAIWRASGDDDYGHILRLLILLGSRRKEIGSMKWSEIDLEAGTWMLPAERSKNRRSHTLPLPPAAFEIIRSVPQTDRDHVFGNGDVGFNSWNDKKRTLDQRLGDTVKPWTLHDLRRSCATKMADIGIAPHIIEAILNHVSGHKGGVAGIYNRSQYDRECAAALVRWSEHVLALVEGRAMSNIVELRAGNKPWKA